MPTNNNRESLIKTIEERYKDQNAGGAFNAKLAGKSFVDDFNNEFADGFTKGGQNTHFPKKESILIKGLDTRKYKP